MASTRYPGKPLIDILGLPMIEHVRRRVQLSPMIDEVIVATCDQEIADEISKFGGKAVMTSNSHVRCTDRVTEASEKCSADIIINVQGDEPLVRPEMLEDLLIPLIQENEVYCTNLMAEIKDRNEYFSTDVVKTVCDRNSNALYFTREPVPSEKVAGLDEIGPKLKQLGIIAFRRQFLFKFTTLPPTPLEIAESVDMLRALEHCYQVRMVETKYEVIGVDTPQDHERAIAMMKNDDLYSTYVKEEEQDNG